MYEITSQEIKNGGKKANTEEPAPVVKDGAVSGLRREGASKSGKGKVAPVLN
jgi:hypothetical protein